MDIYQPKKSKHVRKELRSALHWTCKAIFIGPANWEKVRKSPEASACQAYYGHLSAEKEQAGPKGTEKRSALDLSVEQRPEKVQKRALDRRIMDIYQPKRCSQVQKDLQSAPLWTCQLGENQKKSRSERQPGILWTLFHLFYVESFETVYYTYCISDQKLIFRGNRTGGVKK